MTAKRRAGLTAAAQALAANRAKVKEAAIRSTGPVPSTAADRTASTAITIQPEDWKLLRAVAFARAQKGGGRASVSAVIGELIAEARAKLKAEAGPFYAR